MCRLDSLVNNFGCHTFRTCAPPTHLPSPHIGFSYTLIGRLFLHATGEHTLYQRLAAACVCTTPSRTPVQTNLLHAPRSARACKTHYIPNRQSLSVIPGEAFLAHTYSRSQQNHSHALSALSLSPSVRKSHSHKPQPSLHPSFLVRLWQEQTCPYSCPEGPPNDKQ